MNDELTSRFDEACRVAEPAFDDAARELEKCAGQLNMPAARAVGVIRDLSEFVGVRVSCYAGPTNAIKSGAVECTRRSCDMGGSNRVAMVSFCNLNSLIPTGTPRRSYSCPLSALFGCRCPNPMSNCFYALRAIGVDPPDWFLNKYPAG